jgi:formate dehydrogenase major subunit
MSVNRRDLLKYSAGIAAGMLVDPPQISAATKQKLEGATEFTTACNFCSCGCGMVGHLKDGKLINLEGDPEHVINQGALCSKGAAMFATHNSEQRVTKPMYRAAGSDKWETISWEDALTKVASKMKQTRDTNWITSEKDGDQEFQVNRTDAIGFMGGAQNTNEECYLITKMARVLGTVQVEHQARL